MRTPANGPPRPERPAPRLRVVPTPPDAKTGPSRPVKGQTLETAVRVHVAGMSSWEGAEAIREAQDSAAAIVHAAGAMTAHTAVEPPDARGWVTVRAWGVR